MLQNRELAKLRFRRSQLLEKIRMGLVHLLLTSDRADADAMTESICEGLIRNVAQQESKAKKARHAK